MLSSGVSMRTIALLALLNGLKGPAVRCQSGKFKPPFLFSMPKLDRYLLGEFTLSFIATLSVLLITSVGGVLVDVLGRIADGRMPAQLLLSQLGLQFVVYLPIILPMALLLGLALAISRLYRDSEMAVLTATGVSPLRLLRPVFCLAGPIVLLVALTSLWLGPKAERRSAALIENASRSMVVTGLEAGKFTSLPGGGIVYLSSLSADGKQMGKVFMQRTNQGRMDVVSANSGSLFFEGTQQRFLKLEDGYRVEGPTDGALDYHLMRYASNAIALPPQPTARDNDDPELLSTPQLLSDSRPKAQAQLHWRITPPLLALAFTFLVLPMSRSAPRQARHGQVMLLFLAYVFGVNMMILGRQWIAAGKLPPAAGLWWLSIPLLVLGIWLCWRDGRLPRAQSSLS